MHSPYNRYVTVPCRTTQCCAVQRCTMPYFVVLFCHNTASSRAIACLPICGRVVRATSCTAVLHLERMISCWQLPSPQASDGDMFLRIDRNSFLMQRPIHQHLSYEPIGRASYVDVEGKRVPSKHHSGLSEGDCLAQPCARAQAITSCRHDT